MSKMNQILALIISQGENLFYQNRKRKSVDNLMMIETLIGLLHKKQKLKNNNNNNEQYIQSILNSYILDDFKAHFRITRTTMELVFLLVSKEVNKLEEFQGTELENIKLQCLVTVWILGNQESFESIADRFNIDKNTAHIFFHNTCDALNRLGKTVIKWPSILESDNIIEAFEQQYSLPGIIGCIDATYIDIEPPIKNRPLYLNHNNRTTLILQTACNHQYLFTDCFVGYPGSYHKGAVFQNSPMFDLCRTSDNFPHNSHLIGDQNYPNISHLLVPFKNIAGCISESHKRFNDMHYLARMVIKRAFMMLKSRWKRLNSLDYECDAGNSGKRFPFIIMAACILHNICIRHNDEAICFENIKSECDDNHRNKMIIFNYKNLSHLEKFGDMKRREICKQIF